MGSGVYLFQKVITAAITNEVEQAQVRGREKLLTGHHCITKLGQTNSYLRATLCFTVTSSSHFIP